MNKKVYFYFPEIKKIYFSKDMFLLLKYLHHNWFLVYLVTFEKFKVEDIPDYINTIFIKDYWNIGWIWGVNISFFLFTIKNAHKIDILYFFHNYLIWIYGILYKLLNWKWFIYSKSDFDEFKLIRSRYRLFAFGNNFVLNCIGRLYEYICFYFADIVSVEQRWALNGLLKNNLYKKKLLFLPNGFDDLYATNNNIKVKLFKEKENIILYIWRVGSKQKDTELFLQVLEKVNLIDWKVYIIGHIQEDFLIYIDNFWHRNPHLHESIFFTGQMNISDIYEYYNRAKIFCLTSVWEWSPNVFPEALYFRNFILTTNVSGAKEITNNNTIGKVVLNNGNYIKELQMLIDNDKILQENYNKAVDFYSQFTRSNIIISLINSIIKRWN